MRLEDIVVEAPRAAPITEVMMLERLAVLARAASGERARATDEASEPEDELVLDLVLDVEGALISGGVLEAARTWSRHPTLGFVHEAVVGAAVGARFDQALRFPADYLVKGLGGANGRARGRLRAATLVEPLDLDDPAQLRLLGRGQDMHAVMRSIGEALEVEAEAEVATAVRERVIDALLERSPVEVEAAWIDAGLEAAFDQKQRPVLEREAKARIDEARALFVSDPLARAIEARKLKSTLVLREVCERAQVELTKEAVTFAIERTAHMLDESPGALVQRVKADPALDHQVTNLAMQMVALGHVLERVQLKGAPKRFSALGLRMGGF